MSGYDDDLRDPAVIAALLEMTEGQPTASEGAESSSRAVARGKERILDPRAEDEAVMREIYQGCNDETLARRGIEAERLADPVADHFPDPFADPAPSLWPSADQIVSLARTKKHRGSMTTIEEDEYRILSGLPPRGCLGDVPARGPLVVDPDGPPTVGVAVPSVIKPIDLRSGVSAQLSPKYKTFQNIRRHPPRTGKPIVIVSGDGSPEGTHFEFEGSEAPGPVMGINIVINVANSSREMASGVVTCMVDGEARPIPVWVRFGEHPIHAELLSSKPSGSALSKGAG